MDISQRDVLALGCANHVELWQQPFRGVGKMPYMQHVIEGSIINDCRFAAFEDVLGIGHSKGFASILVPGSCCSSTHRGLLRDLF
eukprot:m.529865 g.529865  ORF g.529865 m.529865 type:complete len:85 (+) comp57566_c0_seq8:1390-1644(+)